MKRRTLPAPAGLVRHVRLATALVAGATALLMSAAMSTETALSITARPGSSGSTTASTGRAGKITTEFRFTFDRRETLRPGTLVRDVTGHGNNGTVATSGGGHLRKVKGHPGRAARFPCRGCGRALINVQDGRNLDPGRHPFWFGAAIKVRDDQALAGRDPNIMQKGLIHQAGGRWKLELIGSRPQCTVSGAKGTVVVRSTRRVDNAIWHTLQCRRANGAISLYIDGKVDASKVGPTGGISNNAPVRFGAKDLGKAGSDDQYHGRLDSMFLKIDRR